MNLFFIATQTITVGTYFLGTAATAASLNTPMENQTSVPTAQLMAVVGDSISAGFIANTISLTTSDPYYTQTSTLWPDGAMLLANTANLSLDELQNSKSLSCETDDSISSAHLVTALNAGPVPSLDSAMDAISVNSAVSKSQPFSLILWLSQLLNHKNTDSWASGQSIYSHFVRLQKYLQLTDNGADLRVKNFAFSGALTEDLPRQAQEIVSEWNSGAYAKVTYITVLIGANDTCSDQAAGGVPDDQMANNLRAFFLKLSEIKQADPIHILVSSLPNIANFGAPEISNHLLPSGWTCGHDDQHYCNSIVNWSTPDEYARSVAIVQDKNQLLQSISDEMTALYPQFQIFYSDKLFQKQLVLGQLAEDCFHPDWYGQQSISDLLWIDQPWWH